MCASSQNQVYLHLKTIPGLYKKNASELDRTMDTANAPSIAQSKEREPQEIVTSLPHPLSEEASMEPRSLLVGGISGFCVASSNIVVAAPVRAHSKCLVSEHEDNCDDELSHELQQVPNTNSIRVSLDDATVASELARMIPPEEPCPHVPSEDGADEASDESEYEYEDEEDTHFSGFLMTEHSSSSHLQAVPTLQQPSCEETEQIRKPARIETTVEDDEDADDLAKKKWREPSKQAVSMSLRAERENTGGKRRLAADLYKIMMADTEEAGFSLEPKSEDSMDKWVIKLFKFDKDSNLSNDMLVLGIEHIELEMSFPDQYPFEPPFVRVVRPRFKRQTGFVMNGALCMELLTNEGWNPINDIESVIVSIRSLLVVGDGRLQAALDMPTTKREAILKAAKEQEEKEEALLTAQNLAYSKEPPQKKKRAESEDFQEVDFILDPKVASISKTTAGCYTAAEAQSAYSHLSEYHKKKGWDSSGWWARKG